MRHLCEQVHEVRRGLAHAAVIVQDQAREHVRPLRQDARHRLVALRLQQLPQRLCARTHRTLSAAEHADLVH